MLIPSSGCFYVDDGFLVGPSSLLAKAFMPSWTLRNPSILSSRDFAEHDMLCWS